MAYPSWVAPQALDPFGGFQGGFNVGSVMGGQAADRRAFDQWQAESSVPYGQTPQTANPSMGYLAGLGQPSHPGSLASLGANSYGQPQAPQQPQSVVAGSHGAVQGATVPGLQGGLESYISNTRAAESSGNPNAKNPRSSATGLYQFTTGTWNDLARQYPNLGLTPDGRTDPGQQERAMRQFTANNAQALQGAGIPVNPGTLYASHFLGSAGALSVLGMADNTPMGAAVSPEVINANPFLRNMTVGDFKAWSNEKGGGANGGYQAPVANAQGTGYQRGGSMPSPETLRAMFASPALRETAIQYMQARDAGAPLPDYDFMTVNGQIIRTNATNGEIQHMGDFNTPSQPVRPMTPEERQQWGIPDDDTRPFMMDSDGTPKLIGGSGQTINVGGQGARDQADAQLLKDIQDNYATALRLQPAIVRAKEAVMAAPDGYAGNMASLWGSFAGVLGLEVDEGSSEAQVLSSITTQLAGLYRLPGPVSDAEMQLYMQAAPRLGDTRAANLAKIELFEKLMNRSGDIVRLVRRYAGTEELYDRLNELNEPIFTPEERAQLEAARDGGQGGGDQPPRVTSQQEYDAIPSGTQYLDADGNLRVKG